MEWFLRYHPLKLQKGNFGPILAHKSGQIKIRGPNFLHVVESIVIHHFKSKSQNLWSSF